MACRRRSRRARRNVESSFEIEAENNLRATAYASPFFLEEEIKPRETSLPRPKDRTDAETDPLSALDLGLIRIVSMFSFFDIYLL